MRTLVIDDCQVINVEHISYIHRVNANMCEVVLVNGERVMFSESDPDKVTWLFRVMTDMMSEGESDVLERVEFKTLEQ